MTGKIDLVIPMVFPQDRSWRAEYARSSGIDATRHVRFRSWGTEELLVQCCMKYMPWLRYIHILLASESQVQPWMKNVNDNVNDNGNGNKNEERKTLTANRSTLTEIHPSSLIPNPSSLIPKPQVKLVFHRDFIPASQRPCFNVNTIEMFLHKIPDLSEYFIYSNDDIFPLSPLQPEDFFREVENEEVKNEKSEKDSLLLPCQRFEEHPYPSLPNTFQRFVMNGLNMVAKDFGKRFTTTWLNGCHSMQPMLRSTVEKVCTLHAARIGDSFTFARTARNFNQYIFPFYQHLSGAFVKHTPRCVYVWPAAENNRMIEVILDPNAGIVCINDNEEIVEWEHWAEIVRNTIRKKLS